MNTPDAEFDNFLTEVSIDAEQRERDKLALDVAKAACDDALDYYNVPTTYRFDDERRAALEQHLNEDERFQSAKESIYALQVAVLICSWSKGIERSEITEQKKQLMADIYVENGVTPDSPWLEFIDELVPGDTLDFTAIDDLRYISIAQQKIDGIQHRMDTFARNMLASATDVLGQDYTEQDFARYMLVFIDLNNASSKSKYEQQSIIDELMRKYNVPRDYIDRVNQFVYESQQRIAE